MKGSCHCGAVRYQVTMKLEGLITCNCSICARTGSILGFVPAERFELVQGEESLTDYQFNKNVIHHLFCKVCGVRSFARGTGPDGKQMVAINVRCLDEDHGLETRVRSFDGQNWEKARADLG